MFQARTEQLLNLVSRSFALCIPMLPEKVKGNVANFYLLCRYADSIEDSNLSREQKDAYLNEYISCVKKESNSGIKILNGKVLPFVISKNDKKMIKVFDKVIEEFSGFDEKTRKISKKWLSSMCRGMQKYSKKEVDNFRDLNNYCYFVAGTVGMYLTDIFTYKFELEKERVELQKRAKDFGLLLQKVNIIRDFSKDHNEGRVFWPKKLFRKHNLEVNGVFDKKNEIQRKMILKEMVSNAQTNIKNAVEYIELLPKNETGLKVFCAIPLCMALPTLLKCEDNEKIFEYGEKVKIDRIETIQIVDSIKKNISNEDFIRNYCTSIKFK